MNYNYHRILPQNAKDSYSEFDVVDFNLSFPERSMVVGTLRLEGEVEGLEGVIGETGKKQQLFQQVGAMQQLQQLLQPTIVEPIEKGDKTPDIITPYDFSSIFATPEEEERLISPYDKNEELLNLIRRKV